MPGKRWKAAKGTGDRDENGDEMREIGNSDGGMNVGWYVYVVRFG